MTIEEMIKEVLGDRWLLAYNTCMVIFSLGVAIAYQIFMVVYFKLLVKYVTGLQCSEEVSIASMGLLSFLLLLIRSQDNLKFLSYIGLFFVLINYLAFTIHAITRIDHHTNIHKIDDNFLYGRIENTIKSVGGFFFAFEFIGPMSQIRKEMKTPTDFMKVLGLATILCYIILVSFGVMHALSVPAVNSIFFLDYEPAKHLWVFAL